MTAIAVSKVLLLGCGGALGYYFVLSYLFQHFPLPLFFTANTFLEGWHLKRQAQQPDVSDFWWKLGKSILNVLLLLVWWLIFAGFAYLLYRALAYYLPDAGHWFWYYYGIGLALPTIWVAIRSVLFFRKCPVEEIKVEVDTRPLLEQVAEG
jgi:hypothetical protein